MFSTVKQALQENQEGDTLADARLAFAQHETSVLYSFFVALHCFPGSVHELPNEWCTKL